MNYRSRNICYLIVGLMLWVVPVMAQLQFGDNLRLNLNGNLDAGYAGMFSNQSLSEHGLNFGGNGSLGGYYFNPNFISFTAHPFYNRSQSNFSFQSIVNTSGFDSNVNIFSGSHFPGFVGFSKSYDNTGVFGIPGSDSILTHGDGQTFSMGWSALIPGLPTLSASFTQQAGSNTVFGTDQKNGSSNRTFMLRSDYALAGFRLDGSYVRTSNDSTLPEFVTGTSSESNGGSNSFSLSASHAFPLSGSFAVAFNRSSFGFQSVSVGIPSRTSGVSDSLSTGINIHPLTRVTGNFGATYTDNLSGTLGQNIITSGGIPVQLNLGTSRSLTLNGSTGIALVRNVAISAGVTHQQQYFLGQSYGSTQFSGSVNFSYSRPFLGALYFSVGAIDTATQNGNNGVGLSANVNFSRKIHRFEVGANFSYGQYLQTLVATTLGSSYSYGTSLSRKLGDRTYWNFAFGGGHSGFTERGSSNHSELFSSGFSHRGYAAHFQYSQNAGVALLTANGLVAIPTGLPPGVLPPDALSLYNAHSYGVGLSGTFLKRLQLTGSFSRANGFTVSPLLVTTNNTDMLTAYLRYPVRKMFVTAGYTRFMQSISSTATLPSVVNSYNFGISRWFSVF